MGQEAVLPKCPNCGAALPLAVAASGGRCPYCAAEVPADPALQRAEEQKKEDQARLETMSAQARAAEAQAAMMRSLAELTAQGQKRVEAAEQSSRRVNRLYWVIAAALAAIVLARIAWNNYVVIPRMERQATAAQEAPPPNR